MSMKRSVIWLLVLGLPIMFIGCHKSSSSSDTTGVTSNTTTTPAATPLNVASKVSVVDAKLSGSVAAVKPLNAGFLAALATTFTASADYYADKTNVYVEERSAEQFGTINMILCMIGDTKFNDMLNKGDYVALIDRNVCDNKSNASGSGQTSQQSQSSSSNMPDYMKFTVNSSRADGASPEYVKVWIHQEKDEHDPAMTIYGHVKIDEGTSTSNPYGIFTMDFAAYPVDATGAPVLSMQKFHGSLRAVRSDPTNSTSKVLLQFASSDSHDETQCGGTMNSTSQVSLDRASDGASGAGHVKEHWQGPAGSSSFCTGSKEFDLAFNSTDFFRKDLIAAGNPSVCLDRVHFQESSWSYGLYDTNGARVKRDSGFSITYTSGGKTYNGWIGYWGLWIDNSAPAITNGATVNQVDYRTNTSTPYTVFASSGKLKKHVKKSLTLGDIKGLPLGYFEMAPSTGMMSQPSGTNYQVQWDAIKQVFNKVAQMPQNCNGNCMWSNILPDTNGNYPTIDVTHLQWGNLNFWSQNGGGQFQVQLSGCLFTQGTMTTPGFTTCSVPTNAIPVIFYSEDLVYPGDATVPTNLACYDNCPTVVNGQATMSNMMSQPSMTPVPTIYSFSSSALMLKDGNGANVISTVTNSMQQWGIMTGALFDNTNATTMSLLACPWDVNRTCTWQAMSVLPVYYTWETGPNSWNQFMAIKDASGAIKRFDPPLEVKYKNASGTTFLLDYSGFGQLNGIPGKCVNMDTGADADCSQGGNGNNAIRWVPQFTISGMTLVDVTDPSGKVAAFQGYVKPLEVEQRMTKDTTAGACSTLSTTDFSSYTLPDLSTIFTDPTTANGAEPTVTSAPAVIGGVVQ